jgi:hypothetical protein
MNLPTSELIGGAWLAAMNHVETVMPLSIISRIGGRRASQITQEVLTETYVESMRPESNLRGHLTFHLKHEIPHLELLSRLFHQADPQTLAAWINAEPSGQYARRTGFLYEFLTGLELTVNTDIGGAYIDAIDDQRMVAASKGRAVPNRRWRVRNNMPGSSAFCPVIRKTADSLKAMAVDVTTLIHELADEFGEALLMRSAVWMTLRESKSSFAIEGEADQSDRIQRFASVLSSRTGQGALPLDQTSLAELQSAILGQRTTLQKFGIRQSPVFVGEVLRFQETVHYVAPPPPRHTSHAVRTADISGAHPRAICSDAKRRGRFWFCLHPPAGGWQSASASLPHQRYIATRRHNQRPDDLAGLIIDQQQPR